MVTILSSKPVKRRSCLAISSGLKEPSRSRGHGLAALAVALVGAGLGLVRAAGAAQMVAQLCAQGALDQALLERQLTASPVMGSVTNWGWTATPPTWPRWPRSSTCHAHWHRCSGSSCYASHTKFRTDSLYLKHRIPDRHLSVRNPCLHGALAPVLQKAKTLLCSLNLAGQIE